jgi:hypothetical protein
MPWPPAHRGVTAYEDHHMITRIDLYQHDQDLVDTWTSAEIAAIDLDASARKFMSMLADSVRRDYPSAVVAWQLTDVTPSRCVSVTSDTNYQEQNDTEQDIDQTGADLYESQSWQVSAD